MPYSYKALNAMHRLKKNYVVTRPLMKPSLTKIFDDNLFILVERHIRAANHWTYRVIPKAESNHTVFYMLVKWDNTRSDMNVGRSMGESENYPNGAKTLNIELFYKFKEHIRAVDKNYHNGFLVVFADPQAGFRAITSGDIDVLCPRCYDHKNDFVFVVKIEQLDKLERLIVKMDNMDYDSNPIL